MKQMRTLFTLWCILSSLSAIWAVVPVTSTREDPVWYRIQLPNWSDGAGRSQRILSTNGENVMTIESSSVSNFDVNLWRLEGANINNAKLMSRDGHYIYSVSGANNSPVKATLISSQATWWNLYSNSAISGSYYAGLVSDLAMRLNAGGESPGSFQYSWGVGLYNQNDNASSWIFTRVFGGTVSVSCNSDEGLVYIGNDTEIKMEEVMSQMSYTLHAVPVGGYYFKEWRLSESPVSQDADYTVTMPELSAQGTVYTYTAVFEKESEDSTPIPVFNTTKTLFKVGSNAKIEVSCSNTSAKIYYTLDGTEPTEASAEITEGFINLDTSSPKTYTVKIAAQASGLTLSRVATATYRIVVDNAPAPLLPVPNERQMYYLHHPHAAFIHYGMNTYTNKEWGSGLESPSTFNPPKTVDTDQWASVLKECGFDRVVLTGKHHDGFCLWPSKANTTNPHTIAQSPYLDGKGDLFESLSNSCTKYGLDMGVYLSPWDAYEENVGGHYTSDKYNDFYNTQLVEVLGKYGRYNEELKRREIVEVWLDGATGSSNPPVYDFNRFVSTMRQYQPTSFIWIDALNAYKTNISGDTCRIDGSWAMNEQGQAPDPCWNKLTPGTSTNDSKNKENGQYFHLLEADVSIRSGWFYGDGGGLKSAKDLFNERFMKSIGRGIPLILNIPPDKNGVFADKYVDVLRKYKEYLDISFGENLMPKTAKATASQVRGGDETFSPAMALDGDYDTYWTMNDGQKTGEITVDFGKNVRFDMVQLQEYIPLGQRIKNFTIEVCSDGKWVPFGSGTTIGYRRIVKTKEVEASGVRINITASLAVPLINSIALYRSHPDLIETDLPPVVGEDGQFRMATDFMAADETDGKVEVKVQLIQRSNKEVSVYLATLPGTGVQGKVYEDKTETIVFEPGVTEKTFSVNLINNANNEGYKDFFVEISSPSEDATIGKDNRTRILVFDDEQQRVERTINISSQNEKYGSVRFFYPDGTSGQTIKTSSPVIAQAIPEEGYSFMGWYNAANGEFVSSDLRYIDVGASDLQLQARFDQSYPVMTRTFTNGVNQQNRYLRSVTTTGTKTPKVFLATNAGELPYTVFPSQSIGSFIETGALINKCATPIVVTKGVTSFAMTFLGYTAQLSGYSSELNWTQQACYVDWNKDGTFEGTNEVYPKSSNTIGNDGGVCASFISATGYTRTIAVPIGITPGSYRMRIVYYEPQNKSDEWQKTLFTTLKGQLRNGVSYDFEIEVQDPATIVESTEQNSPDYVKGGKGKIECFSQSKQMLSLYNLDGSLFFQTMVEGKMNFSVRKGLYIAHIGKLKQTVQIN